MMDKLKQNLQYLIFKVGYAGLYVISLLPMSFLYALAYFAYFITYYLAGYRKEVVIQNIARSFPEKRYGEINAIVKKFYSCFVSYFAEFIKGVSARGEDLEKKIEFDNLELVDQLIKSGRPVIAALGHCGNWEMLNLLPRKVPYNIFAVYKPLHNKFANSLMLKLRTRFGLRLIPAQRVSRYMLSRPASPAVYLFLADQCPNLTDEHYRFTFLNQETYFFPGMEKLARGTNAAVIYLHITQSTKGHYKVSFQQIIDKAASAKEGEITQKYLELLTENIKEEPYGWLWTHKRWKK